MYYNSITDAATSNSIYLVSQVVPLLADDHHQQGDDDDDDDDDNKNINYI